MLARRGALADGESGRVGRVLTTLQRKSNVFLIAEEISYSKKLKTLRNPTVLTHRKAFCLFSLMDLVTYKL